MEKAVAMEFLQSHFAEMAKNYDVKSLAIFGSTARDEAEPDSDLDLLVEFNGPPYFDHFLDLSFFLEDQLKIKVDLVQPHAIRKELKADILREAIYVTP
ncbi:MAG: nucleotidyltransferase family protein [Candidatus Pacebacteria bacterium]|nr:nucleotidyltransferase family protein [Candidatus Paceibacterota bacterium]